MSAVKGIARKGWELLPVDQRTWGRVVLRSAKAGPKAFLTTPGAVRSLRRGFLPKFGVLYGLQDNDAAEYLNERDREVRCWTLNGAEGKRLLDDKAEFGERMTRLLPDLSYETYGRVVAGVYQPEEAGVTIEDLVARHGCVVIKPTLGRKGQGVRFVGPEDADIDVSGLPDSVVTEFVRQHGYSSTIFPGTTNTIRVLMVRDTAGPFVAAASHRFGTRRSAPADNFTVGGLSSAIDLATGELGRAVAQPRGHLLEWQDAHPDTGAPIAGVRVPRWDEVVSAVLRMGEAWPFLRHVGWDLVVTEDAVKVIEGNNHCEVSVLQVHRPLLRDPRVRAFYAAAGVTP